MFERVVNAHSLGVCPQDGFPVQNFQQTPQGTVSEAVSVRKSLYMKTQSSCIFLASTLWLSKKQESPSNWESASLPLPQISGLYGDQSLCSWATLLGEGHKNVEKFEKHLFWRASKFWRNLQKKKGTFPVESWKLIKRGNIGIQPWKNWPLWIGIVYIGNFEKQAYCAHTKCHPCSCAIHISICIGCISQLIFTCANSFNSPSNHGKYWHYPHFTDKETEVKKS